MDLDKFTVFLSCQDRISVYESCILWTRINLLHFFLVKIGSRFMKPVVYGSDPGKGQISSSGGGSSSLTVTQSGKKKPFSSRAKDVWSSLAVTSGSVATSALTPNKPGTSAAVDISCVEEEVKMEMEEVEEVVLTTSSTPHVVPSVEAGHLYYQCCGSEAGSGSVRSLCFWASWIRIRILPSPSKNSKKKPWFLLLFDFFLTFIFEKWCKCTFKKQ